MYHQLSTISTEPLIPAFLTSLVNIYNSDFEIFPGPRVLTNEGEWVVDKNRVEQMESVSQRG
jgi:hypothetical protein